MQCGWCGALNDHNPALAAAGAPTVAPAGGGQERRLRLREAAWPAPPPGARLAGALMLTIVLALIGCVAVVGMAVLLPGAFGPWPLLLFHYPLTALLLVNVLFNYAACILCHPGELALAG